MTTFGTRTYKCFNCNKFTNDVQLFTCTRAEQSYLGCKTCKNYNVCEINIEDNIYSPNVRAWNHKSIKNVLESLTYE